MILIVLAIGFEASESLNKITYMQASSFIPAYLGDLVWLDEPLSYRDFRSTRLSRMTQDTVSPLLSLLYFLNVISFPLVCRVCLSGDGYLRKKISTQDLTLLKRRLLYC